MFVIARAYGDRPLRRVVTGKSRGLVYIANPSAKIPELKGSPGGVGFPVSAVFKFDEQLMTALDSAWASGDATDLSRLWTKAVPL